MITGVNDAAEIGAPTVLDVTEDAEVSGTGKLTASGSISVSDADKGQGAFQTAVTGTAGNLGILTLAADGTYSYVVDNSLAQYLGAGESKIDSFTVRALDGTAKEISFTITGANDAAVIGTPTVSAVTEDAGISDDGELTASGTLSISDADQNQNAFQTDVTDAAGNLGILTLAADGTYSYVVDNNLVQYLGAGESKVDSFTVRALDGTAKEISFTINGVNDAAEIGTPTVSDVTEDAAVSGTGKLTASGSISVSDADKGQAAFQTDVTGTAGNLGILTLAADGTYSYVVDNSLAQYLGAGESKIDSFTVKALDGTAKEISFTITGTNDAAEIGTPTVSAVTEDAAVSGTGKLTASGSIPVSDADKGQAAFQTDVTDAAGNLGILTLAADGTYSYVVDNSLVQYLGAGESKVDSFTVKALDGTAKEISFTITGVNDAAEIGTPTVSAVTEDAAVSDAGKLTASGTLSISDADQNQGAFQTDVTGAAGNLGSLTLAADGTYSYVVDNSLVQYLGVGESKVDSFTVKALDGTAKEISFTINGVNEATIENSDNRNDMATSLAQIIMESGSNGNQELRGSIYDDKLYGGTGGDTIYGGKGNDIIYGNQGSDQIWGGSDNDTIYGDQGNDQIWGGSGNDTIYGNNGDDILNGGLGNDTLIGGSNNDTFIFKKGEANGDTVTDFIGNGAAVGDTLKFEGYGSGATFTNNSGTDTWTITHSSGTEIITLTGVTALHTTDYSFG